MQDDWEKFKERAIIIVTSLYCIIMAAGMYYDMTDDPTPDALRQRLHYLRFSRF